MRRSVTRALIVGAFVAGTAAAATIDKVRVLPGAGTDAGRIEFDVSSRVPFEVTTLDNPRRVVVDFAGARPRSGLDVSSTQLAGRAVKQMRANAHGNGFRVVVDLADRLRGNAYMIASPDSHGDKLIIELKPGPASALPTSVPTSAPTVTAVAPAKRATRTAPTVPSAPAKRDANAPTGALRDFIVAIDAGHGGEDPGAIGVNRIEEKRVALAIAQEVAQLFNTTPGYRGELTRTGDYYLTLRQRTIVARKRRADLFVSVHADSAQGSGAAGASVYTLSAKGATSETARWLAEKENASDLIGGAGDVSLDDKDALLAHVLLDLSMDANRSASIEAGTAVLSQLDAFTSLHRDHVEQAGFVVLKSPDIPSMLVETGYLSNSSEALKLSQSAYQKKIAQAIFKGIATYAQRHPPPGTALASRQQNQSSTHRADTHSGAPNDLAER